MSVILSFSCPRARVYASLRIGFFNAHIPPFTLPNSPHQELLFVRPENQKGDKGRETYSAQERWRGS